MISFYLATTDEDFEDAKILFEEYAASIKINLDFQHFSEELDGLKTMYARPYGGIIIAKDEKEICGCVALRKISDTTGELKRMYIKPACQNRGIGKTILSRALQLAADCNYAIVKLDTLNYMHPAIHLYKQAGFYETPPYYHNPVPEVVYFEKVL